MNNRNLLFTILGLLLIIPVGFVSADLVIQLSHVGEAEDIRQTASSGFTGLHGPTDVQVFYNGTIPLAIVTAYDDDAVTILTLEDPLNPKQISVMTDSVSGVGCTGMDGPTAVKTWLNSTHGYAAAISSHTNDGVIIVDLGSAREAGNNMRTIYNASDANPACSTHGGSFESHAARATADHYNSATPMNGAIDIALLENETSTTGYYVMVAGNLGDAVQLYSARDVSDGVGGGHFMIAGNISNAHAGIGSGNGCNCDGRTVLDGVTGIDTFKIGTVPYGIAAAQVEDGIQIFSLRDPFQVIPYSNATKATSGFELLDGASDVATWTAGGTPYAIVTASVSDAVTIVKLATAGDCNNASCLEVTDTLKNSEITNGALDGANRVDLFTHGEFQYAAVSSNSTGGLQILNLHNPNNIEPVAAINGNATHSGSRGAWGFDTFTLGDDTYAVMANYYDDAIQVIKLTAFESTGDGQNVCGVSKDCSAPTINRDASGAVDDGFAINGINMPAVDRFNDVDGADVRVGNLVTIKAKVYDTFGPGAVEKANLYFDMQGTADWSLADAAIKYDITRGTVTEVDNNDIYSVEASSQEVGDILEVTFKIMFTDSMDTSHVGLQTVDHGSNYQMIYFRDAITVTGQATSTQTSAEVEPEVTQTTATVPDWVKNTAGWWAEGAISEGEFVNAIEHLVKTGTIIII